MEILMEGFTDRVNRLIKFPVWVPVPANVKFRRAMRVVDGTLAAIIAERRQSGEDRGDLLSMLLAARDEDDGTRMTDRQLRDEAMTLFIAGHETTATALAWAVDEVWRQPALLSRLRDSLSPALRKRMQGKSCFNFTTIEPGHLTELAAVTKKGIAGFKNLELPWA
jgi:cytochrome P450